MKPDSSELERYRPYLRVLAETQTSGALRVKCSPSDLAQEVLIKAHREWDTFEYRSPEKLVVWLRNMLANEIRHHARAFTRAKRDLRREMSLENGLARSSVNLERWLADESLSPLSVSSAEERALAVATALDGLPDEQRSVLLLHYHFELTTKEIARKTGRSAASVAGLIRRGLAAMRERLSRKPEDDL